MASVTFIDSIPGADDADGLVVLIDGSLRRYIKCEGINAHLFDEQARENLASTFANFANNCESEVQIIVRSRALQVDEFLAKNLSKPTTKNDYLSWFADYTEKWFHRVQDVHFVPQREFYVVVTYQPVNQSGGTSSNKSPASQTKKNLQAIDNITQNAYEQLRQAHLRPVVLSKKQVRDLIYSELNPTLAKQEPEAPPAVSGQLESEMLAASALKVSEEYLWLDGRV